MKKYIGFKMVEAEAQERDGQEGYKVVYPDGYVSWSPKDVFEKAYMQVGDNNSITQSIVDGFIEDVQTATLGEKTTIVSVTLVNGFEIVESSSCVDPNNYDEKLGEEICLGRVKNKVWELLGFLLQTAKSGIK